VLEAAKREEQCRVQSREREAGEREREKRGKESLAKYHVTALQGPQALPLPLLSRHCPAAQPEEGLLPSAFFCFGHRHSVSATSRTPR